MNINKKVKRILCFAENIEIFKGSFVARLKNVVPNGGTVIFYLLTSFVDSQVLSTAGCFPTVVQGMAQGMAARTLI